MEAQLRSVFLLNPQNIVIMSPSNPNSAHRKTFLLEASLLWSQGLFIPTICRHLFPVQLSDEPICHHGPDVLYLDDLDKLGLVGELETSANSVWIPEWKDHGLLERWGLAGVSRLSLEGDSPGSARHTETEQNQLASPLTS